MKQIVNSRSLHLNIIGLQVSALVQQREFHDGFDEELQSWYLNEDKLLDYMEDDLLIRTQRNPGFVVDYHGSDFFPQAWFDLVVVLRCDNGTLHERLERRFVPSSTHPSRSNFDLEDIPPRRSKRTSVLKSCKSCWMRPVIAMTPRLFGNSKALPLRILKITSKQ